MVKKIQKRIKDRAIIGLIAIGVIFLCASIGFLVFSHKASPQSDPSVNTEGWPTYRDNDLPFTFDYPSSVSFEKKRSSIGYSENSSKLGYVLYTLQSIEDGQKGKILSVSYRDGYDALADHANECFQYKAGEQHRSISVSNKLTASESIQKCGERKRWEYGYDGGRKEIVVVSYEGMDEATFKAIIESLR